MLGYISMREITHEDYLEFLRRHREVIIGDTKIRLRGKWNIKNYAPPQDYTLEKETVWSFPNRGNWATHIGDYRGNWSPYIPRNIILRYSRPGDWVLDQMCGSGTTLIECKLLGRNAIGVDINPNAIMVTRDRLNFTCKYLKVREEPIIRTYVGDARNLNLIEDKSIDLIATHPPYANIIPYSKQKVPGDLSNVHSVEEYVKEMRKVAEESYRVLKPGKYCAILVGDTRRNKHYVPIAFRVMQAFLDVGFILKEDIIKRQWKMKITEEKWRGKAHDFYLIAHEHMFVFRKPRDGKEYSKYGYSIKWW